MKLLLPDTVPTVEPEPLSELEARLRGSDAHMAQAEALEQLAALELRLRTAMAQGVPPAEFPTLSALLDACHAAREVLTMAVRSP